MNTETETSERPLGRRERRKRKTREALLEAAFTLFAERGYHETTVDEIADAAGVSRRTAFRYVPTKHSLVFPEREHRLVTAWRAAITAVVPDLLDAIEQRLSERNT